MFIGRSQEKEILEQDFKSNKSSLIVIYGRRRIGKSSFIKTYAQDKKFLYFEGLKS